MINRVKTIITKGSVVAFLAVLLFIGFYPNNLAHASAVSGSSSANYSDVHIVDNNTKVSVNHSNPCVTLCQADATKRQRLVSAPEEDEDDFDDSSKDQRIKRDCENFANSNQNITFNLKIALYLKHCNLRL